MHILNEKMTEHSGPAKPNRDAGGRVGALVLAGATIVGIVVCVLLAKPFLGALTWALALAILFAPLHARIEATLKYPNLGALVSVLIIALVVALPAAFVAERLIQEAATSAALVQARVASGALQRFLEVHPSIAPIGSWVQQQIDLSATMASLVTWLSNVGASFARGSVLQLIEVLLTFYLLFYFLRDRRWARCLLQDWLPLTKSRKRTPL